MKTIPFLIALVLFSYHIKIEAQCNANNTISVCDMTVVDGDSNGTPDGIINLYEAYNAIPGILAPINSGSGTWNDPNFNFALDNRTGDLYLWDLDNSSTNTATYTFQLIDSASSCPDGVVATLSVILGPFQGNPLPPSGVNDANVTICEAVLSDFDLFQVFESQPSPHENGVWAFVGNLGNPNNFKGLTQDGKFSAEIPYVPGGDLIEFDVFEFTYTVPGIAPCNTSSSVNFKVEVIRDVQSGTPTSYNICETDVLSGLWDSDINLRDDMYLAQEDIEGLWSSNNDPTGQISNPLDSIINLREAYNFMKANNPKFNCEAFTYTYTVESRSTLSDCADKSSDITFLIYEPLKPFRQNQPLNICADGTQPNTLDLYDQLTFTTENGIIYDYPDRECTNWSLVSGPSNLGLVTNINDICAIDLPNDANYTPRGTINLANLTNADAGTYVFRYTVSSSYVCAGSTCPDESANVTITIWPKLYAGENTQGLEFCETDPAITSPLNLFTLMDTNGIDGPIYQGANGFWTNLDTGAIISNPLTLPNVNGQQTFNFLYTTRSNNNCIDRSTLSFTVYESYQSGSGSAIDVCTSTAAFNLFDVLTGNPNTNGVWTGPNGYVTTNQNAVFDPSTSLAGTYTYTVPDNVNAAGLAMCAGNSTGILVTLHQSPNAGSDMLASVCQSDGQVNLIDFLDPTADSGGTFVDSNATGQLTGSQLAVSQLNAGIYEFQYQIQGHPSCAPAIALIRVAVDEVSPPIATNQTFCVSDGATIANLQVSNGNNFNWYHTIDASVPLPLGTLLVNGEDYYVAALDANACESSRVQIFVTLLPINDINCGNCIKDGISVNNDNINDEFTLCNLPTAFPNFEIIIYNRYGAKVYKGNKDTPLFNGISNVPLTLGKQLPSGVYFYVFDPKDGGTKPFQGDFYLSR